MSHRFSRPALGYLVALLLFASPAVASADSTTVTVVNSVGVPQADTQLRVNSGFAGATDGGGSKTLTNLGPGEVIQATRGYNGNPSDPCNAPEQEGVKATVSNPVPAAITITVPSLTLTPFEPGLSNRERGVVGLINNLRREHGLQPLIISTVLNQAADGYVGRVLTPTTNLAVAHCSLSSPFVRDIDVGYPSKGYEGENIVWAASATEAFNWWLNDPPHLANMLNSHYDAIGIANEGDTWVTDFSNTAAGFVARAGWTGDYGDASLADKGSVPNGAEERGENENGFGDPGLRFKRLRVRGHQLRVTLTLAREAKSQGRVVLIARQLRQRRSLVLNAALEARTKLGAGRWSLQAKFIPKASQAWEGMTIFRQLRIVVRSH
jgi:uncharacterized protein YkwD